MLLVNYTRLNKTRDPQQKKGGPAAAKSGGSSAELQSPLIASETRWQN